MDISNCQILCRKNNSDNIYILSKDDVKMVFAFQIKGANMNILNQFYLSLLNLHFLYGVSKCRLQVKMFKYVTNI